MSKALLTASLLLATLLLGAQQASAAPPTSPNILTPADPPVPRPCEAQPVPCDLPTLATDSPTTDPPASPASIGTATSTDPVAGSTTPTGQTTQDDANWWLVAVPVLALLTLAAAGAFLAIQRTERRPS
jgi:hypothetical protein